jgi:hypothetical protein
MVLLLPTIPESRASSSWRSVAARIAGKNEQLFAEAVFGDDVLPAEVPRRVKLRPLDVAEEQRPVSVALRRLVALSR